MNLNLTLVIIIVTETNRALETIKRRQVYSDEQVLILEEAFEKSEYLEPDQQSSLSQQTGLTMKQVKFWFQNKRSKPGKKLNRKNERQDRPIKSGNKIIVLYAI